MKSKKEPKTAIGKFIQNATSGLIEKILPTVFKDHAGKLSSKRIFKIVGSGSLITTGIVIIQSSIKDHYDAGIYAGLGLCAIGAVVGVISGSYIKEAQVSLNEKSEEEEGPIQ